MAHEDLFDDDDLDDQFISSDLELKKEISRLKRQIKKDQKWHDHEILALRGQVRDLVEKNMQLTEANNIFARGLEHLRKDSRVVTEATYWHRGGKDLSDRIKEIASQGKRIVAMVATEQSSHGHATHVTIVTEYYEKVKSTTPDPRKLFDM